MRLGQDVLCELGAALDREWLITNGLGGSASGTAAGANARRTHALLVACGPHGRLTTLLLRLEERVMLATGTFEIGCGLYSGGIVRPAGHELLEEFRLDPWPTWRYRAGELVLEKSAFLIHRHNAVVVSYRHIEGPEARLTLSPLVVARDPLALQRENPAVRGASQGVPGRVRIEMSEGTPPLTLWHNGAFLPARVWQRQLEYPLDHRSAPPVELEDAFVPGHVEGGLSSGVTLHLVGSAEDDLFRALAAEDRLGTPPPRSLAECVLVLERAERARAALDHSAALEGADFTARQAAAAHGSTIARRLEPMVDERDPWVPALSRVVIGALARRAHRLTLLPELPAESERGSDSLRAVPALIALRDFEIAREVVRGAIEYLHEGLAPEGFDPGDGTPRYGDPAAALWLVAASEIYARRSEDLEFLRDPLYPALEGMMQFYRAGTHGVCVDDDGLLSSGNGDLACRRADLNALWYHALVAMAQLAKLVGRRESSAFYLAWARDHQQRFHEVMWDEAHGCLYRALGPEGPRAGLEPSQLLAVSLAPPLLPPDRAARLVETVERELFTPYGLRDSQGSERVLTAWLGAFHSAYLRAHGRDAASQAQVREWLEPLRLRIADSGAAGLPASFRLEAAGGGSATPSADGDRPMLPRGDGSVSVVAAAEILRVWVEELDRAGSKTAIA